VTTRTSSFFAGALTSSPQTLFTPVAGRVCVIKEVMAMRPTAAGSASIGISIAKADLSAYVLLIQATVVAGVMERWDGFQVIPPGWVLAAGTSDAPGNWTVVATGAELPSP
jgi:hypothetical protein